MKPFGLHVFSPTAAGGPQTTTNKASKPLAVSKETQGGIDDKEHLQKIIKTNQDLLFVKFNGIDSKI